MSAEPLLPFARDVSPLDPPSAYADWRAAGPVRRVRLPDGRAYWLVTRHQEIRDVLADRTVSADPAHEDYPRIRADDRPPRPGSFITSDAPEHTRLRRMLHGAFRPAAVERFRPTVERLTAELLDRAAGCGGFDLATDFALPLQTAVLCDLLGVPFEDRALFHRVSLTISDLRAGGEQVAAARAELSDYLLELLARKDREPADDLFSELAVRRVRTGEVTPLEAAGMGTLLLFAGQEPTANTVTLAALTLMQHPEQARVLVEEPSAVPRAVEELLRYTTVIHFGMRRVATRDMQVGDVTIRAGQGIICPLQSANRDAAAFADPDRLDVRRDARRHVAFGFGVHQCIGQPLARLELQVALPALFGRVPGLRPAVPVQELRFRDHAVVYGPERMPVTW